MAGTDTKTDPMTEIRDYEANCNGSENVYSHWTRRLVYTDGVKFVADKVGAHWLVDAIASHQMTPKVRAEVFQHWTLTKNKKGSGAVLTANDGGKGNGPVTVAKQKIEFTDFPLPAGGTIEFFLEDGVLMLKAER